MILSKLFKRFILICLGCWTLMAQADPKILVLGDSISASFGMPMQEGWVAIMQKELQQRVATTVVINASISGETTQGGLTRLPSLLAEHQPTLTIIELGGNDGLRGTPINVIQNNLSRLIKLAQQADSQVLLLGMQIPPNYGARYTDLFKEVYPRLARSLNVELVPFLLEGVADQPELMQADGIHPRAEAQPIIWKLVENKLMGVL